MSPRLQYGEIMSTHHPYPPELQGLSKKKGLLHVIISSLSVNIASADEIGVGYSSLAAEFILSPRSIPLAFSMISLMPLFILAIFIRLWIGGARRM